MDVFSRIRPSYEALLDGELRSAVARMAENLVADLPDELQVEGLYDLKLARLFALAEGSPWRDQQTAAKIRHELQPHYAGVPERAAKWGHEAHELGKRAFHIHRSTSASARTKARAHQDAYQAHLVAAHHLRAHPKASELHKRAANWHRDRQAEITGTTEEKTVAEQKKQKKMPATNPPLRWASDSDHKDLQTASDRAREASIRAADGHATPEDHEHAARMNFIAQGVALAHRNPMLAQKHAEMVPKHREQARKIRVAAP